MTGGGAGYTPVTVPRRLRAGCIPPCSSFFAPQTPATRSPFHSFPPAPHTPSLPLSSFFFLFHRIPLPRQSSSHILLSRVCTHPARASAIGSSYDTTTSVLSVAPPLAAAAAAAAQQQQRRRPLPPICPTLGGALPPAENSYVASFPRVRSLSPICQSFGATFVNIIIRTIIQL